MWQAYLLKHDNDKILAVLDVGRNKNGLGKHLYRTEWGDIEVERIASKTTPS